MITIKDDWRQILQSAVRLANYHHARQKDLAGRPYIDHVIGVYERVEGDEEKVVAMLHDILEDTSATEAMLRRMMPKKIVDAVVALTHVGGETYPAYIRRLSENRLARHVKIADLKDNLDPTRPLTQTPGSVARIKRYQEALSELENVETFGNFIDKNYGYNERHWSQEGGQL